MQPKGMATSETSHIQQAVHTGMPVPGTMTSVTWETLQDPTLYFGIPVVGYRTADGSYLSASPRLSAITAPRIR